VDVSQLYVLVGHGEQRRNIELKRSMSWNDNSTKAKVVKAILGMSNIRDGGYLILGFEQENDTFKATGVKEEDISTFNYDNVKSLVSEFADPFVEFFMEVVTDEKEGKKFLVFTINEFNEIPVICKRDGLENLEKGMIYTRSRRMSETVRVPTNAEMREIVDMAIEKGIRKYIETSYRGGLQIRAVTKEDEYEKELENIK
jgi:hypothetical protein